MHDTVRHLPTLDRTCHEEVCLYGRSKNTGRHNSQTGAVGTTIRRKLHLLSFVGTLLNSSLLLCNWALSQD